MFRRTLLGKLSIPNEIAHLQAVSLWPQKPRHHHPNRNHFLFAASIPTKKSKASNRNSNKAPPQVTNTQLLKNHQQWSYRQLQVLYITHNSSWAYTTRTIDAIASSVSWKAYTITMAGTRKAIIRALRRKDHGEDYEKAAQTLQHFHSLASSSLNVILEDDDDASTRRGMIKTQTCPCLTALQNSTERKSTSSLFSQEEAEDDEWGYFSEPLPERPATPVRDPPTNFHQNSPRGRL